MLNVALTNECGRWVRKSLPASIDGKCTPSDDVAAIETGRAMSTDRRLRSTATAGASRSGEGAAEGEGVSAAGSGTGTKTERGRTGMTAGSSSAGGVVATGERVETRRSQGMLSCGRSWQNDGSAVDGQESELRQDGSHPFDAEVLAELRGEPGVLREDLGPRPVRRVASEAQGEKILELRRDVLR